MSRLVRESEIRAFDNRHVLEPYCQDDVTVLRQACGVFRREFMQIGHIDVFVESIRSSPHAIRSYARSF